MSKKKKTLQNILNWNIYRINIIYLFCLLLLLFIKWLTYITGNTLGNTTDPSAKYWYNTRVSLSSVEYLTNVANTVNTNAWIDTSCRTSGSNNTFDSFETDERASRSYYTFI